VFFVEGGSGIVDKLVVKLGANFSIDQATLDLIPVLIISHSLLQPVGVITETVLLVPSLRHHFAGAFVGDNESEDGEAEEDEDQDEHDEQVDPEEPCHAAARADQPRQGDQHEEHAEDDDGHVQKPVTLGSPLVFEPDPGP